VIIGTDFLFEDIEQNSSRREWKQKGFKCYWIR